MESGRVWSRIVSFGSGTGNPSAAAQCGDKGTWKMENGKWKSEERGDKGNPAPAAQCGGNGKWKMENGKRGVPSRHAMRETMENGKCHMEKGRGGRQGNPAPAAQCGGNGKWKMENGKRGVPPRHPMRLRPGRAFPKPHFGNEETTPLVPRLRDAHFLQGRAVMTSCDDSFLPGDRWRPPRRRGRRVSHPKHGGEPD